MKYSWFKSVVMPPSLLINADLSRKTLLGVAGACLLIIVSGCTRNSNVHHDDDVQVEWDIDPISAPATDVLATDVTVDDINSDVMIAQADVVVSDPVSMEPEIKVAAIEAPKVQKKINKRPAKAKMRSKSTHQIAPSACADPYRGQDDTISLATTADLKLRQGPSTSAATISVFAEGTLLTARKLTCGNWTEIVKGKRTIGYVHSYFLTAP